jgi:transposase InsO family protein
LVKSCTKQVVAKVIYENIITIFGFPLTLINDPGTHFVNETIKFLLENFLIDHRKTTFYHPQANKAVESFNKILHKVITNICGINKDDWDDNIHTIVWVDRSTFKTLTRQTPFKPF